MKSTSFMAMFALLVCLVFPPSTSANPSVTFASVAPLSTLWTDSSFGERKTPSYAEPAKSRRVTDEGNERTQIGNRRIQISTARHSTFDTRTFYYHGERNPQSGKPIDSPEGALGAGDGSHLVWKELRHPPQTYQDNAPPIPVTQIWYLNGESIDSWQARQVRTPGQMGYSTLQWFLSDRMGTVQALTNDTGTPLETYTYSAFGVRTVFDPSGLSLPASALDNPIGFTGREHDPETGLTYYRARYMDPVLGRFTSEDPIGFEAGDFNVGRYVGNSPLAFFDPTGMSSTNESAIAKRFSTALSQCLQRMGLSLVDKGVETGIYLILSADGFYVGKSKNLTSRAAAQAKRFVGEAFRFRIVGANKQVRKVMEQYAMNLIEELSNEGALGSRESKNRIRAMQKSKYDKLRKIHVCDNIVP